MNHCGSYIFAGKCVQPEEYIMSFNTSAKCCLGLVLAFFFLSGCSSECSDAQCPVQCVGISFVLLQNGTNIIQLEPQPYPLDSIRVESSIDPVAPTLLTIGERAFSFVTCDGVEYKLHLNDSVVVDIRAEIDTALSDACCDYFGASSIRFNGNELCSSLGECEGEMNFEIL